MIHNYHHTANHYEGRWCGFIYEKQTASDSVKWGMVRTVEELDLVVKKKFFLFWKISLSLTR